MMVLHFLPSTCHTCCTLSFVFCGLSSVTLWPAFAACTNLRGLELYEGGLKVTEKALQFLSRNSIGEAVAVTKQL